MNEKEKRREIRLAKHVYNSLIAMPDSAYVSKGKSLQSVLDTANDVLKHYPDSRSALQLKKSTELALYELDRYKKSLAASYREQAGEHLQQSEMEAALKVCVHILTLEPTCEFTREKVLFILEREDNGVKEIAELLAQKKYTEAHQTAKQFSQEFPSNKILSGYLAESEKYITRELNEAAEHLCLIEKELAKHPESSVLWYMKGRELANLGVSGLAVVSFNRIPRNNGFFNAERGYEAKRERQAETKTTTLNGNGIKKHKP